MKTKKCKHKEKILVDTNYIKEFGLKPVVWQCKDCGKEWVIQEV